jgi:PKD repeat protein
MGNFPDNPAAPDWHRKIEQVKRQMENFITALPEGTEVRLFSFAKDFVVGPKCIVRSDADRETLRKFVKSLQATGPETRLWRSLDTVMKDASGLAEAQPGLRVRVLAYSDGEDTESGVPTRPEDVLPKYRKLLRQALVRLTYVTIGFELQAEMKRMLQQEGVIVRKALTPDDIIPLQADFTITPNETEIGIPVTLADQSIGAIQLREMDWGDGTVDRGATHSYKKLGEYLIRLTITSVTGQRATATKSIRVKSPPEPIAAFKVSAQEVMVGQPILLVNESTGRDLTHAWSFGDQRGSTETNPSVSYSQPGTYTIQLSATDALGRTSSKEQTVRVVGLDPPVAVIVGPKEVELNAKVVLVDRSSGQITSHRWLVNGRLVSTHPTCELLAEAIEELRVRLEVAGPGGVSTAEQSIIVRKPPSPKVTIVGPTNGQIGQPLRFFGRIEGAVSKMEWLVDRELAGKNVDLSHTFKAPRRYELVLRVTGPGGSSEAVHVIEIRGPRAPVADCHIPTVVEVGQAVEFVDRSTGEIDEREWFIDNQLVSKARDFTHTFEAPRDHKLRIRVHGPGGTSVAEHTIQVKPWAAPVASFVIGAANPRVGESVVLTDTSQGPVDQITWFFPARPPLVVDYRKGQSRSIEHTFSEVAKAMVRIEVRGPGGQSVATKTVNVKSRFAPPRALVTVDRSRGRGSMWVQFTNRSTGSILHTEYDFGDGSPKLRVPGAGDARHEYQPGCPVASVKLIGPAEFAPELIDLPIVVDRPLPSWVPHLWWIVPCGFVSIAAATVGLSTWRRKARDRRLSRLAGALHFKAKRDPTAPYRTIQFSGLQTEERVSLTSDMDAVVHAATDPLTGQIEHSIEVIDRAGHRDGPVPLPANDRIVLAGFEFNLVQA